MSTLTVFLQVSLDGYYCSSNGDMSWAHKSPSDTEWNEFIAGNSSRESTLLFGRTTYEMMASFWPTPQAYAMSRETAENINRTKKVVVSRSLRNPSWGPVTQITDDAATRLRELKQKEDLVTLGSGTLVTYLAENRLVDYYTVVFCPVVLGSGKSWLQGLKGPARLSLKDTRAFKNGTVVANYTAA